MAQLVTTGSLPRLLQPGVESVIGLEFTTYEGEHKKLYLTKHSDKRFEEVLKINDMGVATIKSEGDAIQFSSFDQAYGKNYVHVMYANGFAITKEASKTLDSAMNIA